LNSFGKLDGLLARPVHELGVRIPRRRNIDNTGSRSPTAARADNGMLERLNRYESVLWRQTMQTVLTIRSFVPPSHRRFPRIWSTNQLNRFSWLHSHWNVADGDAENDPSQDDERHRGDDPVHGCLVSIPRSTRENRKVAKTDPQGPPNIQDAKNGGAVQE
jgi:hypothetical protein